MSATTKWAIVRTNVQIPRPPVIGDRGAADELRSVVISESLIGAATARPKGLFGAQWLWLAGWARPWLARRATAPLPATPIYVAVTSNELRLFSKSLGLPPYEIGRWRNYRASLTESRGTLKLELQLERLGRVTLIRGPFIGKPARAVFNLVVQHAAGPVS